MKLLQAKSGDVSSGKTALYHLTNSGPNKLVSGSILRSERRLVLLLALRDFAWGGMLASLLLT